MEEQLKIELNDRKNLISNFSDRVTDLRRSL